MKTTSQAMTIKHCLVVLAIIACTLVADQSSSAEPADGVDEPTIVSVLTLAKEAAESPRQEVERLPLRHRVAMSMRRTKMEHVFGDYADDAIGAWKAWNPENASPQADVRRREQDLYARAKRAFLAGDSEQARHLLSECEWRPYGTTCQLGGMFIQSQLVHWELGKGDLAAAQHRVVVGEWVNPLARMMAAQAVARAFKAAGRSTDGLDFIRSLPEFYPLGLAEILCDLGAHDEAARLLRATAAAALADAGGETDQQKRLPVEVATVQLKIGDRQGAIETLRRIVAFPADRRSTRWQLIQLEVAADLAWAGMDEDAFVLLAGATEGESGPILQSIVGGQAVRGDLEAAFATLERLRSVSSQNPGHQLNVSNALATIAGKAALRGDEAAFRRAAAIKREIDPRWAARGTWFGAEVLRELARVGKAKVALEFALASQDLTRRVEALCMVAEGVAGLGRPLGSVLFP
jgi:hypothetical protein